MFYQSLKSIALVGLMACTTQPTQMELESPLVSDVMTKDMQSNMTPQEAFQRLQDGNQRFLANKKIHRDYLAQSQMAAAGQYPFAAILSCIDSRVSSEILFDLGMGDAFSARVAGNIVTPEILGSLEFATAVAGAKVIAVIGHSSCGAIKGACDEVDVSYIRSLVDAIAPAVVRVTTKPGELRSSKNHQFVELVSEENVRFTMQRLMSDSPLIQKLLDEKKLLIVGGVHDLKSGVIRWL